MSKAGRRKSGGNRYPNGRKRQPQKEEDPRKVALEARQRVFGVSEGEAKHTEAGYTLGRLIRSLVPDYKGANKQQAMHFLMAGNDFAETMRVFMLSAGLGSPTPVALDPNRVRGRGGDKPVIGQAKAYLYLDALKEVDRINYQLVKCKMPSALEIVWQVCVCERDETLFPLTPAEMGVLREGLNRIYDKMPHVAERRAA